MIWPWWWGCSPGISIRSLNWFLLKEISGTRGCRRDQRRSFLKHKMCRIWSTNYRCFCKFGEHNCFPIIVYKFTQKNNWFLMGKKITRTMPDKLKSWLLTENLTDIFCTFVLPLSLKKSSTYSLSLFSHLVTTMPPFFFIMVGVFLLSVLESESTLTISCPSCTSMIFVADTKINITAFTRPPQQIRDDILTFYNKLKFPCYKKFSAL